jgi:uncharacterized membrane protein YbhN (UPF0104 family)/tRNA A-37 threonylcarbamoyl transferase component Bud32
VFGHADERPYRRLTGDWVRLVLAAVVVAVTAADPQFLRGAERSLDAFFASLSGSFDGVFQVALAVGFLWGLALVVLAALVARRFRLAIVLAAAGVLAWFLARLLGFAVAGADLWSALGNVFSSDDTTSYPTVRLAVLAAVVLVASPFLTRPVRRAGQVLLLVAVPGTLILGLGGVDAAAGALAIGWGVAALLHLALGSPAGRPTMAQVGAALAELGVDTTAVVLAPEQPTGSTVVLATRTDGSHLQVRVYGRDAADTRLVAKAWRFLAYKDSGPTLTLSRLQQVEHEAVCLFAARDAGARVPLIVAAGLAGPSAALLALDQPEAPTLADVDDGPELTTAVAALWDDVRRLRDARVAHGALDGEHVLVGEGRTTIIDFDKGSISASAARLDLDVAQALVTTALRTDAAAGVAAAARVLSVDELRAAQRYLTKPALTPATRRALRARKELLDEVTTAVAARTDGELVTPVELRRVKPLNVLMVVALLFALWVILGEVGSLADLWATLKTADWPWLVVGFVLAQSTSVAFACNTIGSVPQPIPLVPAVLLQMAVSFVNLVAPTGASAAIMNIRFLQKQGVEVGAATSSGVLLGLAGTVTQFTLFLLTAIAVGQEASLSEVGGVGPDHEERSLILLLVLLAAVVAGVVLAIRPLRRFAREKVWPQVVAALRNIWGIFTTPRQLFMIMGGSVAAQLLYSLCLLSCLAAYGGSLSVAEIVFVNTSASFLASLVPVPGGIGVMEAAMVSGLTAFGIPPEIATATVVTHRLFTTYLPPIWGNFATKKLISEGYL